MFIVVDVFFFIVVWILFFVEIYVGIIFVLGCIVNVFFLMCFVLVLFDMDVENFFFVDVMILSYNEDEDILEIIICVVK